MRCTFAMLLLGMGCNADAPPPAAQLDAEPASPQRSRVQSALPAEAPQERQPTPAPAAPGRPKIALPPLDPAQKIDIDENGRRRIGAHRELPALPPPSAAWTSDADGAPVWRVEIRSPGAVALRLHFVDFQVEPGAVAVFEADEALRPAAERRYTGRGPAGDGELWSDIVEGEAAIIEYRPGTKTHTGAAPPFRIDKISHMWRSPLDLF